MRFGNWRGVTLAAGVAPALLLAFSLASTPARAQDFHTIPRLAPAIDLNTGGPYNAPPVPFGHYAKGLDYYTGKVTKPIHGLFGKLHGAGAGCGLCGGKGCGACGGGDGGCGHGNGCGIGGPCAGIGGGGHGCGLLGKLKGMGGCGLCGGQGCGACVGHASTTVTACAQSLPTPQVMPSAQCGESGCGLLGKHRHKGRGLCGGLGHEGGNACGGCAVSDPCGGCGGRGCGLCGGGGGGSGCGACGGLGCGLCGGAGKHLAGLHGMVGHLLGRDKIRWFVGPGGPVPLTPGYVPYVNVTRSPRDFFAFPPMTP